MVPMSVTRATFHVEMSPLKAAVQANIWLMSVTWDTSQLEMSPLKAVFKANKRLMSVTRDTSHVPIGPCGPMEQSSDSLRHSSTASLSSCRVFGENTVVGGGNGY